MVNASTQDPTWLSGVPIDLLHFANCFELAQVWGWSQLPEKLSEEKIEREVVNYTLNGLHSALQNASRDGLPRPAQYEVLSWLKADIVQIYIKRLALGIGSNPSVCWLEVCRVERWDGNPDIAGVGMLATYLLQTCLVTIYLVALIMIRFNWTPVMMRNSPLIKRTLLAIQHSTGSFLSASFVFSIAMLFASLLAVVDDTSNARYTTWSLLLIMPISSILPVAILQLAASDTLRRAKGRMLLWLMVFTLTLSLLARTLMPYDVETNTRYILDPSSWEIRCLNDHNIFSIVYLSWGIAGLVCLSIVVYLFSPVVAILRRHKTRKPFHLPRIVWWILIVVAFSAMWTLVGWFTYLTFLLRDRARSSNKDAEWSFGQILALSTWVPFVAEFAYLWWEQPEEALNGRLIDPYEVIKVPEKTRSIELEHTGGDEASARLLHRAAV